MLTESGIFLHVCHIDAITPTGTRRLHNVWFNGRDYPLEISMSEKDLEELYDLMYSQVPLA